MRAPSYTLPVFRHAAPTAVLALLTVSTTASGSTVGEFWPEIDVYHGIDARSRVLFTADATRGSEGSTEDRKTTIQNGQFTFNYDYTLAPVLRTDVPESEWSKNRYLWMRVGYAYGTSFNDTDNAYRSHALISELSSRFPLGSDVWLNGRARFDARSVNGEPSQRYRARLGLDWSTTMEGIALGPYADIEMYYDTRYNSWSRTLWRAGCEVVIDPRWRIEPYLAVQANSSSGVVARVVALGLALKYYH